MPFDPSLPRKSFVVERFGDEHPFKASVESVANPHYRAALRDAYEEAGVDVSPTAIKLTMPDGKEWLIADGTLEGVLGAVQEARVFAVEQGG